MFKKGSNGRVSAVIDLDTASPPPTIRIDGVDYALNVRCAYAKLVSLQKKALRIKELSRDDKGELTEENESELADLLATTANEMVVEVPEDVFARLSDFQRIAVVGAFSEQAIDAMSPTRGEGREAPKSSLAFTDSSAAR